MMIPLITDSYWNLSRGYELLETRTSDLIPAANVLLMCMTFTAGTIYPPQHLHQTADTHELSALVFLPLQVPTGNAFGFRFAAVTGEF